MSVSGSGDGAGSEIGAGTGGGIGSGDRAGSGGGTGFGAGFEAFVETRGHARAAGYRFLGRPPEQRWWQAYREHTSFEQPTLIVESADGMWRAYLGGIPSVRRDVVGTVIHYAVVLGGPCSDPVDTAGVAALRLIEAWLGDIRGAGAGGVPGGGRAAATLDAALPAEAVARMIAESGEPTWSELQRRLGTALHGESSRVEVNPVETESARASDPADGGEPADWMGRLHAERPAAAFRARVAELLAGTPGRALAPNLVDSPAEIADLTDADSPLAVLVLDEPGLLGERLVELIPSGRDPKKAPPPATGPAASPPAPVSRPPRRPTTAIIITVLLALAIIALLAWTTLR